MSTEKPCTKCGETKPFDAYEPTASGGHRSVCRRCIKAAARARRLSDPEHLARYREQRRRENARYYARAAPARAAVTEARRAAREAEKAAAAAAKLARQGEAARQREVTKAERLAKKRAEAATAPLAKKRAEGATARHALVTEADRERVEARVAERRRAALKAAEQVAAASALALEVAAVERRIRDSGMLDPKNRQSQENAVKDALWDTMRHRRALREGRVTKTSPDATHRIRLKDSGGYIGVAELACRVAEREACYRAGKARDTLPAACEIIALLERDTTGPARTHAMLAYRTDREANQGPLSDPLSELTDDELDPFDDGFGDWAPAWMRTARGSWSASIAA